MTNFSRPESLSKVIESGKCFLLPKYCQCIICLANIDSFLLIPVTKCLAICAYPVLMFFFFFAKCLQVVPNDFISANMLRFVAVFFLLFIVVACGVVTHTLAHSWMAYWITGSRQSVGRLVGMWPLNSLHLLHLLYITQQTGECKKHKKCKKSEKQNS